jgi:transcriptional regulator with XRE-family HTH domain
MSAVGESLGRRVREQRMLVGFTQAKLAEKLGVSNETVSRMENGKCMPSLLNIERVAHVLQIDLVELFRFRREATPQDIALDRLLWLMRRRSTADIDLAIEILTHIFEYMRTVHVSDGKKEKRGHQ